MGPHHHWAVVPADGSGRGSRCATDLLHSRPRGENYTRECREGPEEAAAGRRRSKVSGTWNISSQIGGGGERRSKARENARYHWGQRSKRASVITGRSERPCLTVTGLGALSVEPLRNSYPSSLPESAHHPSGLSLKITSSKKLSLTLQVVRSCYMLSQQSLLLLCRSLHN